MNILFITYNKLPDKDAGAIRDMTFLEMLKNLNNEITCMHRGSDISKDLNQEKLEGISYIPFHNSKRSTPKKVLNYLNESFKLIELIKEQDKIKKIDLFWIVNLPTHVTYFLKKFTKRNGRKLVHDSVEWYSPEQFKLRSIAPAYIAKNVLNRCLIDKNFRVVAISTYLEQYYKSKGIKTTLIPIIKDINKYTYKKSNINNKLIITYAGSPGRKDFLDIILKGVSSLPDNIFRKIEFRCIGVSESQFKSHKQYRDLDKNKILSQVTFYGRLTHQQVLDKLEETDFTILIRSAEARYAKAGFPSKVVESMAKGVPVILNITSDLEKYIKHLDNGYVVDGEDSKSVEKAITKILEISKEELEVMNMNARLTFEENFNFERYYNHLEEIIN